MQRIEFAQPPQFALPLFFHRLHLQQIMMHLKTPLCVCVCLCKTTAVEVAKKRRNISLKASPALCEIPGSFVLEHRFIRAKEPLLADIHAINISFNAAIVPGVMPSTTTPPAYTYLRP